MTSTFAEGSILVYLQDVWATKKFSILNSLTLVGHNTVRKYNLYRSVPVQVLPIITKLRLVRMQLPEKWGS
jgi:hypothetical protein